MTIEMLKNKLHSIFESAQFSFSEDTTTPEPTPETPKGLPYTAKNGVVYNVAQNPIDKKITVTDLSGNVIDSFDQAQQDQPGAILSEDDRKAIVALIAPAQTPVTSPATTPATNTPVVANPEPPIAEEVEKLDEVNKKAMQSFIDQYGAEEGKKIYYATTNAQHRNPETFKK